MFNLQLPTIELSIKDKVPTKLLAGVFNTQNLSQHTIKAWLELISQIKDDILGSNYSVEINFVSLENIHNLNSRWRDLDKPTDVLSFPYEDNFGEVYLSPEYAYKVYPNYDLTFENFIVFLIIHSLHHLKGFEHGEPMEESELKYRKKYFSV